MFHVSFKCDFTANCLYFNSVVESNFVFNIFEYVTLFFSPTLSETVFPPLMFVFPVFFLNEAK